MAVYKVPQDVEAEDKLIGPFSFRQFIYLIIVAISGFVAYLLAQLFLPLLIIPLPLIIFFGALALPLRKDQPMETYLAAMVRFFLKPKKRIWESDGTVDLVEIVAPKAVEEQKIKDLSQVEAQDRFNYLAQVMDSRGWSTRGVLSANDSVNELVMEEAASTSDILDDNAGIAASFDNRLQQQEAQHRQEAMQRMQAAQSQVAAQQSPQSSESQQTSTLTPSPQQQPQTTQAPTFDPYPAMHQHVLSPAGQQTKDDTVSQQPTPPIQPVPTAVSPDILNLANNNDLSISALAHEAQRLKEKEGEEVVISLR